MEVNFRVAVFLLDFGKMKINDKEIFQFALQNMILEIGNEYLVECRVLWKNFQRALFLYK